MSKIIKLDENLANQIAAWEVIERPISVVKELVENSIDANSSFITVEIKNGWISEIIVTDNWDAIQKDDLKIVLEKYTTSKIKNLEDLYNVMTFGFRWEALSSISSVSKFKIISKTKNTPFWYFLESEWWNDKTLWEIWAENWTKITVCELFFNTPARLNYLKKARTEYSKIKEFLEQISLSHPKIWFEFISDQKRIFIYRENQDLKTRIYNVYWEDFSNNLIEINDDLMWWLKISWYISDPKISFSNKNRQTLFVNSRIVKSPLIIKSINDAYNRFIAHSQYPAYVLNLEVDPTQVDVNVHPRKLEVRFAQESQIFRWFYHSIENKLNNVSLISSEQSFWIENWNQSNYQENPKYYTGSGVKFKSYSPYKNVNSNPSQTKINDSIKFSSQILNNNAVIENKDSSLQISNFEFSNDLHDTPIGKIIWQIHNSFIIVQTQNWIQILDQHALAERVIYEKLLKWSKYFSIQWLLVWETFKLTTGEIDILQNNSNTFFDMWFDFEILWDWIVMINAIPDFVKKESLYSIFTWIITDIWEQNFSKSNHLDEVKNKIFAYASCRSAIKFWHKLNLFEINKLLKDASLDYSSTCPHWRPVVYELSLWELKAKYDR